jgi:hypothetical protein
VVTGTLSVPALYWAARGFARERVLALLAAALLAVNPMAVWYSQEARAYGFVVLAACVAFGALVRTIEQPGRRDMWCLYVAGMVLMAYSDLLAPAIVLPAQLLIASRGRRDGLRRLAQALLAVLVLCIPLIVAALISHGRRDALYWLPRLDRALVELGLQEFSGGFSGVSAVRWLTLLAGVVLVGLAAVSLRRRATAGERSNLLIAAAWGVLPPVLLLVVSAKFAVFWPRYAIVALPGLCLLGALAARRLVVDRRGRLVAGACVAALIAAGVYADARQVNALQQSWPPVMSWLRATRTAGEPVVVDNVLMLPSIGYYDPAFRAPDSELVVGEWHDTPLPRGVAGFRDPTGYGGGPSGPPGVSLVRSLAAGAGGTVWFVFGEVDTEEQGRPSQMAAVTWARAHCRLERRQSTGVEVIRASGCRG